MVGTTSGEGGIHLPGYAMTELDLIEPIPGALIGRPDVHADPRGFLLEILREEAFGTHFVQATHSHSKAGVLRGLHYHQKQSDAWYLIRGTAQVVLADLRTRSNHPAVISLELNSKEPQILFIPPGVAHGFLAVTDLDLIYWVTEYYNPDDEFGIAWDDPILAAPWAVRDPILSERDRTNPKLEWDSVGVFS